MSSFAERITVAELEEDPYPIYERLRAEAPVAWVPAVEMWLATTWDAALRVASEPELFAADMPGSPIDRSFGSPTILTCDGEPHRELRRSIDPKYRPQEVEAYIEELVGPIVAGHLAAIAGRRGRPDGGLLRADLGPEPGRGAGPGRRPRRHVPGLVRRPGRRRNQLRARPGKQERSDAACAEIDERLAPVLDRLEREPDDSTISHMIHAGREAGDPRPREAYMPSLKVILLGGMQEPGHGAGSVMFALLTHPDALAEVAADLDELLPAAIDEGMRWIAPIGTQGRRTTGPLELEGTELPADAPVAAVIASANRDAARFERPDEFDLHRDRQRLATFGFGRHFCSGHAFARAQERIALRELLRRHPAPELAAEVPFSGWEFRAPRELRVRLA